MSAPTAQLTRPTAAASLTGGPGASPLRSARRIRMAGTGRLPVDPAGEELAKDELTLSAPPRHASAARSTHLIIPPSRTRESSTADNSGRTLEPALRRSMEERFGHDFSRVRVHADAAAARHAANEGANAYTVGHDIVFGHGRFAPESFEGRQLLAHELAHVVQQTGSARRTATATEAEQEARTVARAVAAGERACIRSFTSPGVQREEIGRPRSLDTSYDVEANSYESLLDEAGRIHHWLEKNPADGPDRTSLVAKLKDIVDAANRKGTKRGLPPLVFADIRPFSKTDQQKQATEELKKATTPNGGGLPDFTKPTPGAPTRKEETPFEKFVREHRREITQLPQWNQHFADGLNASPLPAKLGSAWEELKRSLSSADRAAHFYFGFVTGVPIGAVKDVYDQLKGVVEILLKAFLFDQKAHVDPAGVLRDLRKFAEGLIQQVLGLFDPQELGTAIGFELAKRIDGGFVQKDAEGQGRFIGEIVGTVLMEVALLFIGVEEVSAAAKALRGSKVGQKMSETLSLASKELKAIVEARAAVRGEAKAVTQGGKDAAALESATKDAAGAGKSATAPKSSVPPEDPYDVAAWTKYYEENPTAKRSVGAAQADDPHAFTQDKGANIPPEKPSVEVEARTRGGAIERDHLDSMPDFSRPKEHDFPGIDAWKGGRDTTRETNSGRMRIISGADVLQVKSLGSASPATVRARVREGIGGLQPTVFEKGSTRVVNPASRRLDVLFEEGVLTDVTAETKSLLTTLSAEAGNSGIEVRWFRYSAAKKIRMPIP